MTGSMVLGVRCRDFEEEHMRQAITIGVVLWWLSASVGAQDAAPQLLRIPSGGAVMFGAMFNADGPAAKPTVILLHGHPGTSVAPPLGARNNVLELAHPLQRAGFNVLAINYRGAWGSGGSYSLLNRMEDVNAAVTFAKTSGAQRFGVDSARLSLVGHSAGGFNALAAGIHDPTIACVVSIAPANYGAERVARIQHGPVPVTVNEPVVGLAGYTTRDYRNEIVANQARLNLTSRMSAFKNRPLLIVQGKQDETVPADEVAPYSEGGRVAGASPFDHIHLDANHNYTLPGNRKELASVVAQWLTKNCR
jgi:dipeptidyl aminopeptidase/acylaminoacyl peptidase